MPFTPLPSLKHVHQLLLCSFWYQMEHHKLVNWCGNKVIRISYLLKRVLVQWSPINSNNENFNQCQTHKVCSIQILLCHSPFSATCLPTPLSGGTVSPSWRLHSFVCPTCICMNWGTCGRFSSMWRWGPLWHCRSDWGNHSAKHQTIMSDTNYKHEGQTDLSSYLLHMLWKCTGQSWD